MKWSLSRDRKEELPLVKEMADGKTRTPLLFSRRAGERFSDGPGPVLDICLSFVLCSGFHSPPRTCLG